MKNMAAQISQQRKGGASMKSRMSVNLQTSFIQKLAKIQQEKVKIQQ